MQTLNIMPQADTGFSERGGGVCCRGMDISYLDIS